MIGLRIGVVVVMVAVVAGNPCFKENPGHEIKTIFGGGKRVSAGAAAEVEVSLGCFGELALGVSVSASAEIFTHYSKCGPATSVDESLNAMISLSVAVGDMMDKCWPGLGRLYTTMIFSMSRILICCKSSSFFDKMPFFDKSPCICQSSYGGDWGFQAYTGTWCASDVLEFYSCTNVHAQVMAYINKFSGGVGIEFYSGTQRVVLETIISLSIRVDTYGSKWCIDHMTDTIIDFTTIIAIFGNGYKAGFGIEIAETFLKWCNHSFKQYKFKDLTVSIEVIKKRVSKCTYYDFGGSLTSTYASSSSGSSGNSGNSEGSTTGTDVGGSVTTGGGNTGVAVHHCHGRHGNHHKHHRRHHKHHFRFLDIFAQISTSISIGKSYNYWHEISRWHEASSIEDVTSLFILMSHACAGVFDYWVTGFGSFFANLFLFISQAKLCINGQYTTCNVCKPDYCHQYSISVYSGAYSYAGLVDYYKLKGAQSQCNGYIDKCSGGKGIAALSGVELYIAQSILQLSIICDKSYDQWTEDDYINAVVHITTVVSIVAESYHQGYGIQVCYGILRYCNKIFKKIGWKEVISYRSQITTIVKKVTYYNFKGYITTSSSAWSSSTTSNGSSTADAESSASSDNESCADNGNESQEETTSRADAASSTNNDSSSVNADSQASSSSTNTDGSNDSAASGSASSETDDNSSSATATAESDTSGSNGGSSSSATATSTTDDDLNSSQASAESESEEEDNNGTNSNNDASSSDNDDSSNTQAESQADTQSSTDKGSCDGTSNATSEADSSTSSENGTSNATSEGDSSATGDSNETSNATGQASSGATTNGKSSSNTQTKVCTQTSSKSSNSTNVSNNTNHHQRKIVTQNGNEEEIEYVDETETTEQSETEEYQEEEQASETETSGQSESGNSESSGSAGSSSGSASSDS